MVIGLLGGKKHSTGECMQRIPRVVVLPAVHREQHCTASLVLW